MEKKEYYKENTLSLLGSFVNAISPSGFKRFIEVDKFSNKSVVRLLAYGENYHFFIRAQDEVSDHHHFVQTVLPIQGDEVNLSIDCKSVVERLRFLAEANIITLMNVQMACRENRFGQLMKEIEQPLCWKQ